MAGKSLRMRRLRKNIWSSQVFLFAHICSVCVLQACARVRVCVVPWLVSIESHDMAVFGVVLAGGEASTCFTLLAVYVLRVIFGQTHREQSIIFKIIKQTVIKEARKFHKERE